MKPLNPMMMKVRDVEIARKADRKSCRAIELSRVLTRLAELVEVCPIHGKDLDPVVVEVCDEDLPCCVNG